MNLKSLLSTRIYRGKAYPALYIEREVEKALLALEAAGKVELQRDVKGKIIAARRTEATPCA